MIINFQIFTLKGTLQTFTHIQTHTNINVCVCVCSEHVWLIRRGDRASLNGMLWSDCNEAVNENSPKCEWAPAFLLPPLSCSEIHPLRKRCEIWCFTPQTNFSPGVEGRLWHLPNLIRRLRSTFKPVLSSLKQNMNICYSRKHSFTFTSKLTFISALMQRTIKIPLLRSNKQMWYL